MWNRQVYKPELIQFSVSLNQKKNMDNTKRELEKKLKKRIINARKNIQKKYLYLKRGEAEMQQTLDFLYKPIINTLNKTDDNIKTESIVETEKNDNSGIKNEEKVKTNDNSGIQGIEKLGLFKNSKLHHKKYNHKHVYGIRIEDDQIKIGNQTVQLYDNMLEIHGKKFQMSEGLKELLVESKPATHLYTSDDLQTFKEILMLTNAHRQQYQAENDIYANRSNKYRFIISKLFKTKGGGFEFKKMNQANVIYYDDVNELIERLRLLYAEKQAGNTGVDNEIISIKEELREIGLIE